MTIIAFNRYWVVRWYWLLITFFAVAFLTSLSLWQWTRAAEKTKTLARIAQWQSIAPLDANRLLMLDVTELDGAQVKFSGRWIEPMIWLLDNRVVDGRIGYDVVIAVSEVHSTVSNSTVSISGDSLPGPAFLVNLGWTPVTTGRDQLPDVVIPSRLTIDGVFRTGTKGLLLGDNLEDKGIWPMRIQQLDATSLASQVKNVITSGVIFQQAQSPFHVHYQPVVLPPERHRAYAVQWALLAIAVIGVAVATSAIKEPVHDKP